MSPAALSPGGGDTQENPFETEFNGQYDDEDLEDDLEYTPPDPNNNNFAVLNSSLPGQLLRQFPEEHHLTSYLSAKRASGKDREKRQHRTKWHFGIRSRSPPMEVMTEIYRTLATLGMEWKEKRWLGGLGGVAKSARGQIQRAQENDGSGHVDLKLASAIYFVETRARVQDVVVRLLS